MKKIKSIPIWIYILPIFILIIVINIVFDDNSNINYQSDEQTKNYIYESNNTYGDEFEYKDIDIAEEAKFEKYINKEAEQKILNQKVFVRIKELENNSLIDESTSITKIYKVIAVDQDDNKWQIQSDDSTDLLSKIKNKKIYGLYKGVTNDMPIIQMYTSMIDSKYLDKNKFKEIGNNYINSLNNNYSKEKFSFNKFEESYDAIELLYNNENENIEMTIGIDIDKQEIKEILTYVNNSSISFTDIDANLWYSIITLFAPNLTIDDVSTMIAGAEVDAISQADNDILYRYGTSILDGYYEYNGYRLGINLYLKKVSIEKISN